MRYRTNILRINNVFSDFQWNHLWFCFFRFDLSKHKTSSSMPLPLGTYQICSQIVSHFADLMMLIEKNPQMSLCIQRQSVPWITVCYGINNNSLMMQPALEQFLLNWDFWAIFILCKPLGNGKLKVRFHWSVTLPTASCRGLHCSPKAKKLENSNNTDGSCQLHAFNNPKWKSGLSSLGLSSSCLQ